MKDIKIPYKVSEEVFEGTVEGIQFLLCQARKDITKLQLEVKKLEQKKQPQMLTVEEYKKWVEEERKENNTKNSIKVASPFNDELYAKLKLSSCWTNQAILPDGRKMWWVHHRDNVWHLIISTKDKNPRYTITVIVSTQQEIINFVNTGSITNNNTEIATILEGLEAIIRDVDNGYAIFKVGSHILWGDSGNNKWWIKYRSGNGELGTYIIDIKTEDIALTVKRCLKKYNNQDIFTNDKS